LTEPYRIAPNDVLTIHVLANPALTKSARVRPDGRITVPGVGEVVAADREPADLAREIEKSLADLVLQPQVSVSCTCSARSSARVRSRCAAT
jgi:polysaccharide export outer membrane protein